MLSNKIPCAIYTRKSSEEGLEMDFNSLDAQFESCKAYITSQMHLNWEYSKKYEDAGISGGTLKRPALQELIEDIKAHKIKCIVVYKIDRLSRSLFDFAELVKIFDEYEVSFVSITQSFNTANAMGKLMLNVLLSFAQFEREVSGERVRDKITATRKKGLWFGGYIPLGYQKIDGKLIAEEQEEKLVQLVFSKYLELQNVRELADWLNNQGFRKKKWLSKRKDRIMGGTLFEKNYLNDILTNQVYIGKIRHKDQLYDGEHNGIIEKRLFNRVQELLTENPLKPERFTKSTNLLSNKLFDIEGVKFTNTFTKKGSKYYYYYFHQDVRLQASELDNIALNMISQLFENIEKIEDSSVSLKLKKIKDSWQNYTTNLIDKIIYEENRLVLMIKKSALDSLADSKTSCPINPIKINQIKIDLDRDYLYLTLPITFYPKYGTTTTMSIIDDSPLLKNLIIGYKARKLLEAGKSINEIATSINKTRVQVHQFIKLAYSDLDTLESILQI